MRDGTLDELCLADTVKPLNKDHPRENINVVFDDEQVFILGICYYIRCEEHTVNITLHTTSAAVDNADFVVHSLSVDLILTTQH